MVGDGADEDEDGGGESRGHAEVAYTSFGRRQVDAGH